MADETGLALQNLAALNQNFAANFAPLNNYAAQNLQMALYKQHSDMEQANKIAQLQHVAESERQRQEASIRAQWGIARMQEEASKDHGIELAKFQAGHEDAVRIKAQADAVRANPQARRVLGGIIATLPDTPEGNAALMAAYTKTFSDPQTAQKLDTEEAKSLNNEVKTILGRLNTNTPGSAQSKQAVLAFLGTPGVSDLLIKKGKLSAQEIQAIAASGDSSKVIDAIQKTASSAYTPWGERDYLTQLIPAWNSALATAGVQQTPGQMVDATSLKALLDLRDGIIKRGNIYTDSAMKDIFGEEAPQTMKLPPPPASAGLGAAAPVRKAPESSSNPFTPPPAAPSDKTGIAALLQNFLTPNYPRVAAQSAVVHNGNLGAAFTPSKLANDPYTEFELRRQMLDSERTMQARGAGITSALPFVKTFTPTYTAFHQDKDEARLRDLVEGLYSAPKSPVLDFNLLNSVNPSSPTPPPAINPSALNDFFQGLQTPNK